MFLWRVSLCWMFLCWVSLCSVSICKVSNFQHDIVLGIYGSLKEGSTTFSITTPSIMTFSTMTLSINGTQHNNTLDRVPLCWVSLCWGECYFTFIVMLNVVMMSVIMLNVVMLNANMQSVVAPKRDVIHHSCLILVFDSFWSFLKNYFKNWKIDLKFVEFCHSSFQQIFGLFIEKMVKARHKPFHHWESI
jgi:hypothetical protein